MAIKIFVKSMALCIIHKIKIWDYLKHIILLLIKLKKMKAGKKYYIKARAFVKGINGKKIYGAWTKAKRIKLK